MKKKVFITLAITLFTCIFTLMASACNELPEPHTHVFDKQESTSEYLASNATCDTPAKYYYSCSCGKKGMETFESGSMLYHTYGDPVSNGNGTHTKVCANDSNHKITENCSGGSATCTKKAVCKDCNAEYGKLKEHNYTEIGKNDTQHWYECVCGDIKEYEVHNPGAEATEATDQVCTVCGWIITPALSHEHSMNLTMVSFTPQSCTSEGNIEYYMCSCGKWFFDKMATTEIIDKDDVIIQKDEHNYTTLVKNDTEHWWECQCGDIYGTESHKGGTATCTELAKCEVCDIEYGKREEHNHAEMKYNTIEHWYECACGDIKNPEAHSGGTATCLEKAKCKFCGTPYGRILEHRPKTEWVKTDTHHYHECKTDGCVEKLNYGEHNFDSNKKCVFCEFVTDALIGAQISSNVFEINGTRLFVKIPNAQNSFSFVDTISVAFGATYKIYVNSTCQEENCLSDYKANDLVVGDNTFYMCVTNSTQSVERLYTITIRRRPIHTVSFDTDGGEFVQNQYVEEDSFATAIETTSKRGYTFDGWDFDFSTPITSDKTINAKWIANKDTPYKVQHYLQNLEDDGYTLANTESKVGTTDETVYPEIKEFPHFDFEYSYNGKISADGSTILSVYYMREVYTVYFYTLAEEQLSGQPREQKIKYQGSALLPDCIKDGYEFTGWDKDVTNVTEDMWVSPTWQAKTYTITYDLQNGTMPSPNPTTYTVEDTIELISPRLTNHGFLGWNNGNRNITTINKGTFGDLTLTAVWEFALIIEEDNKVIDITTAAINTCYEVVIPDTISVIGLNAFSYFNTLESLTIPKSVTIIEGLAFSSSTNLKKINYLGSINDWVNIKFLGTRSNPLSQGAGLYIDGQLQQNITISSQKVSEYAFYNYLKLTDVTFTEDVTEIDSYAFAGCENLQQIQLPIKLKYIGTQAFAFCGGIQTVTLPKTLEDMGVGAFSGCRSLQEILLEEGIENYYTIDGNLYGTVDGVTKLYHYLKTNTNSSFKIPDGVNEIIDGAFRDSFYLQHVEIPDSVTVIGAFAFYNCQYLETVKMSANIKTIEDSAFENCIRLENVDLGEKLTSIGSRAFYYCLSLTQVNMPNTLTSIGSECFYSCAQVEQVKLSNRLIEIPSCAFMYCLALQTVNGGSLVQRIGSQAFACCSLLKDVDFAKKAITVGSRAFSYCNSIEEFEISNNVVGFFSDALYGCENLKTLIVSTTFYNEFVIMDNGGMFPLAKMTELTLTLGNVDLENLVVTAPFTKINRINCAGIENITISSSVTEIGGEAFYGIKNLKTINLENVNEIGASAFANCCDLETVILSENLTSLRGGTFSGCVSLKNIDLSNVVEIGGWAFSGCTFTTLNLPSVTTLGKGVFENCENLTSIQLPSLIIAGDDLFENCTMLENVDLGNNLTQIGSYLFINCKSLGEVTIPSSVQSIGEYIFKGACIEKLNVGMTTIPRNMFVYIESIGEVELLDTVRRIEDYGFYGLENVRLYLNDNLSYISNLAFWEYELFLASEYNNCLYIGSRQNPYLVLVKMLDKTITQFETEISTKFICTYAFSECYNLYSVVLNENIIHIADWAFSDCRKLVEVYNLSNLEITQYSFEDGCVGAWAFDIYDSKDAQSKIFDENGFKVYMTEDTYYLLSYVDTDKSVELTHTSLVPCFLAFNDKVEEIILREHWWGIIREMAFYGCVNLKSVTIYEHLPLIQHAAFAYCVNLTHIIYDGTMEEWLSISKEDDWNRGLMETAIVRCTDGEVSIFKN